METGQAAIERALASCYPNQQPIVARTQVEPLEEIRMYRHASEHWHYVTLGLSELGHKVSENKDLSGWGIELTFRCVMNLGGGDPPIWPLRTLVQLARYVTEGQPFGENHHVDLGGPVDEEAQSVTALAFAEDPELGVLKTATGALTFLQVVDLTSDEEALVGGWSVAALLDERKERSPLLVANPSRASLLADPDLARHLRLRADREGPAGATAIAETLEWTRSGLLRGALHVSLGPASQVQRHLGSLLLRVEQGTPAQIVSEGRRLVIQQATRSSWETHGTTLTLFAAPPLVAELNQFLGRGDRELVCLSLRGLRLTLRE